MYHEYKCKFVVVLSLSIFFISTLSTWAHPNTTLSEKRAEFIKKFQRTILNTTPGDAKLLEILISSSGARRGVEVGSATGYGAIHMGIAFEANGGHLTTIDIDPRMVNACRKNIQSVGLEKIVTVVKGDALEVLPGLEGPIDFVFIDALKRDYLKYFKAIESKLVPGSIIVADNVIQYASSMSDFLNYIRDHADYEMVIVRASDEKSDGMAIIQKRK